MTDGMIDETAAAEDDPLPLSEVVYARLRQSLMRAELKPHERLKVRDLARQMGTSETPVREALFQLASLWNTVGKPDRAADARDRLRESYPESSWTKQLGN